MEETLRKFEQLVDSLGMRNKAPSDQINLLAEFKDRQTLEAHLKNLQKALDFLAKTNKKTLAEISEEKRTLGVYPVNASIATGTSIYCAQENLINNYHQLGTTTSDLDHMTDAMRVMHAWARLNNLKRP